MLLTKTCSCSQLYGTCFFPHVFTIPIYLGRFILTYPFIRDLKGQLISKYLFGVFNFLQKTNKNKSDSSKIEFIRSFFGENIGWKKLFRFCLTFSVHSGRKCLPRVACLWSKMPMFQRAGMREGGEPLPLAFQYLILMI